MSVGQAEALRGGVLLIVWSSQFPKHRYLPGYLRLKAARRSKYFRDILGYDGRQIINLTPNTALDFFETRDMASVIKR